MKLYCFNVISDMKNFSLLKLKNEQMYENTCFSQRIRILFFGMVKYMGYSSDT